MKKKLNNALGHLVSNKRAVYKKFASTYDMVYFGTIGAQDDDQRMVRGATLSTSHVDNHYCVGTIHGYDMVLLERVDKLTEPGMKKPESYHVTIMQFDLHSAYRHPHVVLDGKHFGAVFKRQLHIKFPLMFETDFKYLELADPSFRNKFMVYNPIKDISTVARFLGKDITSTLSTHFTQFDFEWQNDSLFVYCLKQPSPTLLEHMLRAGLWLAREFDALAESLSPRGINAEMYPTPSESGITIYQDWK